MGRTCITKLYIFLKLPKSKLTLISAASELPDFEIVLAVRSHRFLKDDLSDRKGVFVCEGSPIADTSSTVTVTEAVGITAGCIEMKSSFKGSGHYW